MNLENNSKKVFKKPDSEKESNQELFQIEIVSDKSEDETEDVISNTRVLPKSSNFSNLLKEISDSWMKNRNSFKNWRRLFTSRIHSWRPYLFISLW